MVEEGRYEYGRGRKGRSFGAGLELEYSYKHTLKIGTYFLVLFPPKA